LLFNTSHVLQEVIVQTPSAGVPSYFILASAVFQVSKHSSDSKCSLRRAVSI